MTSDAQKQDITLAKGFTILLVVIGHTLAGGVSAGNEWFSEAVHRLYLFHMPFFMFLSGFLYFRPGRVERIRADYADHARTQAIRLLLPFFLLGFVVLAGKLVMQHIVHVDNVPEGFGEGLNKLFWNTDKSPSMFVWYIFVLYIYIVACPLLHKVFGDDFRLWLPFALLLYFLPYIHHLYLDRVAQYFIFFVVGGWLRHNEVAYQNVIDRRYVPWLLAPIFFAILYFVPYRPYLQSSYGMLVVGLMSIPLIHSVCRRWAEQKGPHTALFITLGVFSYVIYLFNVIVIGVVKGVMFKFTTWDGGHFYYFIPILIVSGLLAPILAQIIVLDRIPFIRDNILGRPALKKNAQAAI